MKTYRVQDSERSAQSSSEESSRAPGKDALTSHLQLKPAASAVPTTMRRLQLKPAGSGARPSGQSFVDSIFSGAVQRKEAPGTSAETGAASGTSASASAAAADQTGNPVADAKAQAIVDRAMAEKRAKDGAQGPASEPSIASDAGSTPSGESNGLVQRHEDPVQMAAAGDASTNQVHQVASAGIQGSGGSLPHLDKVQASFGEQHDVSGVVAHVGGPAAEACTNMGASAYATGNHVAFAQSPDLHTAAHEAAHVVQQQRGVKLYGGVGQAGDEYERNADAVADRVVAGRSAADLLGGPSGGESSSAVQKQTTQHHIAPGNEGHTGGDQRASGGTKDRYRVEVKAWIPHNYVVDPEEPIRISDWLDTISSAANALISSTGLAAPKLKYEYHSKYHGDGHSGYAGSYRAMTAVEFDWDGSTMSAIKSDGNHYGTTTRYYNYRAWLETIFGNIDIASGSGSESKTATRATSQSASGRSFNLSVDTTNPLLMSPESATPGIDADYNGSMLGAPSALAIIYNTDLFPSHGVQVKKNGSIIKTQMVNDASGVPAMGPVGAAMLMARLSSQFNLGTVAVP